MKARDVMVSHVITVGPELDVKAVANTLVANGISAVPVVAIDGGIVGIIIGAVLSLAVSAVTGWPAPISPAAIAGGFLFSAATWVPFENTIQRPFTVEIVPSTT